MFKRLLWVLGIWFLCLSAAEALEIPVKKISHQELQKMVSLNGPWKLNGPLGKELIARVPGPWERYYQPKLLTRMGQGNYQLELDLPREAVGQYFKIYTNLVGGEHFHCEINGQEVGRNGFRPGSTSRVVQFFPFKVEQTRLHLNCQIQNTKLYNSGLIRPVFFGRADLIVQLQLREKMLTNINIGIFLFLALFHILLYLGYRQEIGLLWFASLSLSLGLFGEFYHARNLEFFISEVPVEISSLITRLALFAIMPAFFLYIYAMAPLREKVVYLKPWVLKLVLGLNLGFVLTLFLPIQFYTPFTLLFIALSQLYVTYNIWRLRVFLPHRETYLYAGSNLLFSLGVFYDNLNGLGILPYEFLSRYMMLMFCLLQAIFLSRKMQQNYQQAVLLQQELSEVNQNLEGLVSSRTREVRSQNEELQKLVGFKDEMTRMIVHDLKAPLNTLINLPAQQIMLSEERRQSFESASRHILSLVENMTQLKAAESPQLELHTHPVFLAPLADNVLLSVKNWAQSKRIQLNNQIDPELKLLADGDLLERVLLNLCDNALKHTPIGGKILIGSERHEQGLSFWIANTGPQLPPDMQAKAFEKHQSFALGASEASSGLGLYFCRQVIAAHGGQIQIGNWQPASVSGTMSELPSGGVKVVIDWPGLLQNQPNQPDWQGEELAQLQPVLAQLKRLEVFEVSDILKALEPLMQSESRRIRDWLLRLEKTIKEVHEEGYAQLLAEVSAPADRR